MHTATVILNSQAIANTQLRRYGIWCELQEYYCLLGSLLFSPYTSPWFLPGLPSILKLGETLI